MRQEENEKGEKPYSQALGQTEAGRYYRVVYLPDEEGDEVFVVTVYPLVGKQLQAFRRRQKRRKR